jgi:hypothetical protein
MKKKVIRLTEQDVENLVKKILKEEISSSSCEESDFNWTCDILADGTPYKKYIHNYKDMVACCGNRKTNWAPASSRDGERFFNMYYEQYGPFEVYFDGDKNPTHTCTGNNYNDCYEASDVMVKKEDIKVGGWGIDDVPERDY